MVENLISKLPILEKPFENVAKEDSKNVQEVLLIALNWKTNYWIDCALKWIEQGCKIDSSILKVVRKIAKRENLPQSTKHRAVAVISKWEKEKFKYIDVLWQSGSDDEPFRLVSELDEERFEVRKLEFFNNNQVGYACENKKSLSVILGEIAVPSIENINSQSEFIAKEIAKVEFERLWHKHV